MAKGRGTFFKIDIDVQEDFAYRLIKNDRKFRLDVLYQIAKDGRKLLQRKFLSGGSGGIKAKGFGKGKRWYKVNTSINKRINRVTFTSPILNPLEFDRDYEGVGATPSKYGPGKDSPARVKRGLSARTPFARKRVMRDPGKKILTVKFRAAFQSSVGSYANRAIIHSLKKFGGVVAT